MAMVEIKRATKGGGLNYILEHLAEAAGKGAREAAEETREAASRLARGQVKGCIRTEAEETQDGARARVYNDTLAVPWSSYVEFGTGLYVDNEGIEDAIRLKRAKEIPWYIPVSKVPASFARYGYPLVAGRNGMMYWEVDGQKPHPYMHPAAVSRREQNVGKVAEAVRDVARKAGG